MARRFTDEALTLRQVWDLTYQNKRNRFEFKERDVIKKVDVEEIVSLSIDRLDQPMKKFRITSYSYPQYKPYVNVKGKKSKNQRTVRHQYDITLELESLNFDSRFFWRCGSQRKWPNKIPQKSIKTIRRETMQRWKEKYPDPRRLRQIIKRHKKNASYLDNGDYISQEYGINGDFYWRIQPILYSKGMLFGRAWNKDIPKDNKLFFDKHTINIILWLLKNKKISY